MGYTRSAAADELTYNLATIGQVSAAISNLNSKFEKLLYGGDTNGIRSNGYAWLNSTGKVDTSLLPSLAITDVFTVDQATVKNAGSLGVTPPTMPEGSTELQRLLNTYLTWLVSEAGGSAALQKGDIIVVTVASGTTPDPNFAGSYILTKTPAESEVYIFSKLAYTDGNIVSINDKTADGTGAVRVYLEDVLKQLYIDTSSTEANPDDVATTSAQALNDTLYRAVTIDEGTAGYRFGFVDNSPTGAGATIAYAKLAELNTAKSEINAKISTVSGAVALARTDLGLRTDLSSSSLSASLFAQTKQLRSDVTNNTANVDIVHENVTSLHSALNSKAITLILKDFTWGGSDGNTSSPIITEWSLNGTDPVDPALYRASDTTEIGTILWTYNYPSTGSDERILAVYDENDNQIDVDLTKSVSIGTGLAATAVKVLTAYYGREEDGTTIKNSILGKTWTVLVAKVITNIPITSI